MKNRLLKFSGVLAIIVLWSGISVSMYKAGLGLIDTRPISFAGTEPETSFLFSATLITSAILFGLFGYNIYRKYGCSKWFIITFMLGQIAQVVAALFQYGGEDKLIHTVAAFTLAGAIPTYMLFFALSIKTLSLRSIAFRFYIIELLFFTVGIGAFIFVKGISPLAEILPALPFHAWIIYMTFFSLKQ